MPRRAPNKRTLAKPLLCQSERTKMFSSLCVSITICADYSYEVKNSEIQAPAFFKHNNSFIATVARVLRNLLHDKYQLSPQRTPYLPRPYNYRSILFLETLSSNCHILSLIYLILFFSHGITIMGLVMNQKSLSL